MEWKLFEECKGHSWQCDIHESKNLDETFCLFVALVVEAAAQARRN